MSRLQKDHHRKVAKPWETDNSVTNKSACRFEQAPNTAVITCKYVLREGKPILYVSHDADDEGWQFLCGLGSHQVEDGCIIGLGEAVKMDSTLLQISDLRLGFEAEREYVGARWTRNKRP